MPRYILAALAIDLTLGLANLVDLALGHPLAIVARLIDLDRERALPTWYASMQWFCVAALLWAFATRLISRRSVKSWLLLALPAVYVMLSVDEVAQLHESLGTAMDGLLLQQPREATSLTKTGFWFLFVGIPFVVAFVILVAALRPYLRLFPGPFLRLVIGTAVFLVGAIGLEGLSNLVVPGSPLDTLQVVLEEVFELVGATVVLWASYDLVQATKTQHPTPAQPAALRVLADELPGPSDPGG